MFNQWCTIQSDPGVFTQLVKQIGAPTVQVQEIYSLQDDDLINRVQPKIYGLIFLFKWTKNIQKRDALTQYDSNLFFARQIINNACATQAILSILLNAPIPIQGHLQEFNEFARDLTSQDRGLALSNSEAIRKLHNSFSRPQPFIFKEDKKKKKKQADIYHFVSYIPHKGNLYELDGLQPGPILIGKYEQQNDWINVAKQQIQQRIQKYSQKQIRFNLMVVCQDLKQKAQKQIQILKEQKASISKRCRTLGVQYNQQLILAYPQAVQSEQLDRDKLSSRLVEIDFIIQQKQAYIISQNMRSQQRKQQNIRRKHNYIPLIIQVIKTLAKKNKLQELIEKNSNKNAAK